MRKMKELLEKLAALEHEQWMAWSKAIAEQENISPERLERWKKYWVPYEELDEATKEHDRVWARRVLEIIMSTMEGCEEGGL